MARMIQSLLFLVILSASSSKLADRLCGEKAADIVFILDASSSIWEPNFHKQLDFVSNVIDVFDVGLSAEQTRVGLVTFSDYSAIQFHLGELAEKEVAKKAVKSVGYLTGGTNTSDALRTARVKMFSVNHSPREDIVRIAVVITDGQSKDTVATYKQAMALKSAGIQVFAVGVGFGIDERELEVIASSPSREFVFTVDDYGALNSIKDKLVIRTCEDTEETTTTTTTTTTTVPTTTPTTTSKTTTSTTTITTQPTTTNSTTTKRTTKPTPQPTTTTTLAETTTERPQGDEAEIVPTCWGKPADVFFILDSSTSIWTVDFKKQLGFVKNVIRAFDIGPSKIRVGVSTFSDTVHPMIDFDQYSDKEQLLRAVDAVKYQSGLTYTGDAIEDMLTRAFAPGYTRPGVAHIAVVITDGESREQQKTAEQALLAQKAGIYMFAIGVGKAVNEEELKAIASNQDINYVYTVNSYDALDTLRHILAQKACEVNVTTTPEPIVKDEPQCTRKNTDLMFTINSRRSSSYATRSIITLIDNVIRDLELSMLRLKFGLLQDVCVANSGDIALSSQADAFRTQLNAIQYANLATLIHRLRTERLYMRDRSEKIAVLFVDDKLDQPKDTAKEAHLARRQGIEIFVVAVGNRYLNSEVNSLCSAPVQSHVIRVPDYSKLLTVRQQLGQQICIPSLLRNAGLYY